MWYGISTINGDVCKKVNRKNQKSPHHRNGLQQQTAANNETVSSRTLPLRLIFF